MPPVTGVPSQGPTQHTSFLLPRPPYGQSPSTRPAGPCWHCNEIGHIKSKCPRLNKPYPFDNSHNVVDSGVLLPMGSRSERVEADPCSSVEVVAKSKPADNVERETP